MAATVQINLCKSNARIQQQPVVDDVPVASELITSSGSSQASTIAASTDRGDDQFWCILAAGGAVWVTFDPEPVAIAGTTWLVPDGQPLWLRATPGNKVAVIDA